MSDTYVDAKVQRCQAMLYAKASQRAGYTVRTAVQVPYQTNLDRSS